MRLVLVLPMALMLVSPAAHAQKGGAPRNPSATAKELVKQAARLYDQKKFLEAVEALEKANELMPDTRLIYNIAYAYDQAGRLPEAISYYEKYLVDGEDAQLRKRARSSIDRLRVQVQKDEATAAASEKERLRLERQAETERRRAEAERESARQADAESQLRLEAAHKDALASRRRMQVTSFAIGGVALAGVGLGTVFGLQANGSRADFNAATDLESKVAARDLTRQRALVADIGFGVGLVGAVAAVLLYPKEPVPEPGKARVTLAPAGLGTGLEVSF